MELIDTHTHLYLKEFDSDRYKVIENALKAGVQQFYLPSLDSKTFSLILDLERLYPGICFPMIGLHPCHVHPDILEIELAFIKTFLSERSFSAIGEIGIDLYWEKSFLKEQQKAFSHQIHLAKQSDLPIVIHCRAAFKEVFEILEQEKHPRLRGVFHCFTGTLEQAEQAIHYGMKLGIGGIVTFKSNSTDRFLHRIALEHIVLETDAPYLAPVPYRGKRNEPLFLLRTLSKLAEVYGIEEKELAHITSANARKVFGGV
ncbi:TatD family hydrolase [Bacteroidetes bacterium endosymbiont of Geopemphigus sp.]|uniref:TatD family hydrolase n=1 Tax=Bacteroidetes bacterium endosymbiont of Geopemphigus sp. TaxID=2047937 RepID=UPI000CCFDD33|nr:TatD family hydrolase [Bacteroidetes bacterium endosymbiont of Geopemphigus sp.]